MDWDDIMNEIRKEVHDVGIQFILFYSFVEPLVVGSARHPSSAFCILYKLSRMRITYLQLNEMLHDNVHNIFIILNSQDSPFIRCIGFLYIRFAIAPRELWKFYAPYFDDETPFIPFSDKVTMY